ncbi:MAG: hypothetical protein RL385_12 [Pseudomonadota bacterium]
MHMRTSIRAVLSWHPDHARWYAIASPPHAGFGSGITTSAARKSLLRRLRKHNAEAAIEEERLELPEEVLRLREHRQAIAARSWDEIRQSEEAMQRLLERLRLTSAQISEFFLSLDPPTTLPLQPRRAAAARKR